MKVAFIGEVLDDFVGVVDVRLSTSMFGSGRGVVAGVVFDSTANANSNEDSIFWRARESDDA